MADDDVTPTVEDVIVRAVEFALPRALQPVGASLREPAEWGGAITGYGQQIVDAVTPAVVAAVRAMSPEQLAQLLGGMTETGTFSRVVDDVPVATRVRVVGPWQVEP